MHVVTGLPYDKLSNIHPSISAFITLHSTTGICHPILRQHGGALELGLEAEKPPFPLALGPQFGSLVKFCRDLGKRSGLSG